MSESNVLIYLIRRDLRVSDNPILHHLATTEDHGFTHLLPVCVVTPNQYEASGFINDGSDSPFPEARSDVGGFWRCGPHRAKFVAESIWDLKTSYETLESGLVIRVGHFSETLKSLVDGLKAEGLKVGATWMVSQEGYEERREEDAVSKVCASESIEFKPWVDEKYFIDDRDLNFEDAHDLPDVFTTYRKSMEPLRERPRQTVPRPPKASLPKFPPTSAVAPQAAPFEIPTDLDKFREAMLKKVQDFIHFVPPYPEDAESAHPFSGGETNALARLDHIVKSGVVLEYKTNRNGLVGTEFSTKLSAWLALGCLTGRQVHWRMVDYEDSKDEVFADAEGYGQGENEGTKGVRFELLWRDYMRLCHKKFGTKLFHRSGFREDHSHKWKTPKKKEGTQQQSETEAAEDVDRTLRRIWDGTTGMGLIDATQRELLHTGYTSNRARQNVASFVAKHLNIDWRYGAEWYEMLLVDYDVSSNWANWQYVAGVGNDPRGEARIFNPVKQAFDYDKEGKYVRRWVPEVRSLEKLEHVFQCCTTPKEDWERLNLTGLVMAEDPIKKIEFTVDGKPNKHVKRPFDRRRKDGRIRSATNTQVVTERPPLAEQSDNAANVPNGNMNYGGQYAPQQRQYPQFDPPRSPRSGGGFRGGRGGGGPGGGGGRGRGGYGGPPNRGFPRGGGGYRGNGRGGQYYPNPYVQYGPPPPGPGRPMPWGPTQGPV
ncbi:putative cryptochrome DASH [Apiospora marii]|uniref:putative cryptochrome DASH n=1 Tax=Apiospora marii TaxID=335849 RepID=UPI00312DE5F0